MTALSPNERDILSYCEQHYLINGRMPEVRDISLGTLVPESGIITVMQTAKFREAIERRGMQFGSSPGNRLSELQLTVANVMLDFTDGRSEKKKLDELGVTTQQYQAWLRNPAFKHYLQNRAESLLDDNMHTAHTALLDNIRSGDLGSIKLYYEMTGRHSSKTVGEMNIQFFMAKVLEVIQRHVEPEQMRAIAAEFEVLGQIQQQPMKEIA